MLRGLACWRAPSANAAHVCHLRVCLRRATCSGAAAVAMLSRGRVCWLSLAACALHAAQTVQPAGGGGAGAKGKGAAASDDGWGALDDFGSADKAPAAKSAPKAKPLKLGGATKLAASAIDDWDDW